ncbi:MAG TPA: rod shape-determining protein MreC [Candidatus Competibacteraceae bacterium]|nr:rod shape-determining protein MreC [Candidatus Competibacteraceae bacterium]HQA25729.1 rod shape-determining protein MreC [Candidatus Competibacteraceae bacterium]HQD55575.1 rod shape-determining protein MreC [Candidatus Competibacteraceae bacterium]
MAAIEPSSRIRYLFAIKPAAVLRLGLWVALSIAMMTVDHRYHALDGLRDVLSTAAYPLHVLMQLPTDTRSWLSENLAGRTTLLEENARLREKQVFLNVQLQKLTILEAENRRLRSLLESAVNTPGRVLIAELLAVDFDPYRHHILLNRGRKHGISVGQPVLDQHGVIGQIVHADPLTSTAILITDPNHALPIQLNRTGLRTLARGTGNFQELDLPHIPNNEDVKVGDLLVTSGLGGRFPRGYPVGTVTKVEFDPGSPFARIIAKPIAQLDRIREVMLLESEPTASTVDAAPVDPTPKP